MPYLPNMPNYTLQQLRYFCAVAKARSISAAAKSELVSRSTVSSALDELERSLQVRLFSRQKAHGAALTDAGQRVLERALALLDLADDLGATASGSTLGGALSVGCYPSLAPRVLPVLLDRFTSEYPEVDLLVHSASEKELVRAVGSGEFDLIVAYDLDRHRSLRTAVLYNTTLHVILPAEHPLATGPTVQATDLADMPLILADLDMGSTMAQTGLNALTYLAGAGIEPRVFQRTDNFELIRSLVARGLGYSLVAQRPESRLSYEGKALATLPIEPHPPTYRATIGWASGRSPSRLARTFVEAALKHAEEMQPGKL
jgi:DNA-binding transcriptional LysR family regulator